MKISPEAPVFDGKDHGVRLRFSLKPIHWTICLVGLNPRFLHHSWLLHHVKPTVFLPFLEGNLYQPRRRKDAPSEPRQQQRSDRPVVLVLPGMANSSVAAFAPCWLMLSVGAMPVMLPLYIVISGTGTMEFYDFPIILGMECHHPNWRCPWFFRGVGWYTTNQSFHELGIQ